MDNFLNICDPNLKLIDYFNDDCENCDFIPKDIYNSYKNKHVIFYILYLNDNELILKKLLKFKSRCYIEGCYCINEEITEYILKNNSPEIIDLWNYLHPNIISIFLQDYIGFNFIENMTNLLYIIKNYDLSFKSFNNLNYINEFIKKDKDTLVEILNYEPIENLWSDSKSMLDNLYKVKNTEVLKLIIDKWAILQESSPAILQESKEFKDIHIDLLKIALINNHKSFIKYYVNHYTCKEDFPLRLIYYTVYPEFEDYYTDKDEFLQYKYASNKKNTKKDISNNLLTIYQVLVLLYGIDEVIDYLIYRRIYSIGSNIICSIIRFNSKIILKDIINKLGINGFINIIEDQTFYDLFRYGQYNVVEYLNTLDNGRFIKSYFNAYNIDRFIKASIYNSDDRICKFILQNIKYRHNLNTIDSHNMDTSIYTDFLEKNNISLKTKIQKLRILAKYIKLDKYSLVKSCKDIKLSFWLVSKFFNNILGNDDASLKIIEHILISKKETNIDKLFVILGNDFNYWDIIILIIKLNINISFYEKILQKIFYKLDNIKNYPNKEVEILHELSNIFKFCRLNTLHGECVSCKDEFEYNNKFNEFYDKLLKLLKTSGVNLNLYYSISLYKPVNSILIVQNIDLFKIGILNGISYTHYFNALVSSYYSYNLIKTTFKPYLCLYKLLKSLTFRRRYNDKKNHRQIFRDTSTCLDSRPPNKNIPVLKNGGQFYYESLMEFKSLTDLNDKFIYPIHITPLKLLELAKNDIIITPKIDGVTKLNIDKDSIFPEIPEYMEYYKMDGEYVKELDMYLVFGIRNKDNVVNCIYDDYLELKNIHDTTKNDNDSIITSNNYDIIKNKLVKEYKQIIDFYNTNKGKTLWYPKKFWLIFDTDIILDVIDTLQIIQKELDESLENDEMMSFINNAMVRTDGFIINKLNNKEEFYKIKPTKDMTIDLLYNDSWKDREGNVYDIEKPLNCIQGIYRCVFKDGKFAAKDYRPNKEFPNPKKVVDIVQKYHDNPWSVSELKKYNVPTYYQEFRENKTKNNMNLDKKLWIKSHIKDNYSILDIGCGYLISELWNNNTLKIDGIDTDLGIIKRYNSLKNKTNKKVFIQDMNEKWDFKNDCIKNIVNDCIVNDSLEDKKYNIILLNLSIHNSFNDINGFLNLMKEIEKRTTSHTKLMISFIDKNILFKDSDNIIFDDSGFLKKIKNNSSVSYMNGVSYMNYYYPWRHNKIIKEPIIDMECLVEYIESFGWNLTDTNHNKHDGEENGYRELSRAIKRLVFSK